MAPTAIGIDLTDFPQRIGGRVMGRYIVGEGSKGLKLMGATASTTKEEVAAILKDAVVVVKSIFGNENFNSAIIVIPNDTKQERQEDLLWYGRGIGFNITQVIKEHSAVSAAYVEKVQLNISTNLAIVSLTGGFLEISVVSIVPVEDENVRYHFILQAHKAHPQEMDLDEPKDLVHDQKSIRSGGSGIIGFIRAATKVPVVEQLKYVLEILEEILLSLVIKRAQVDKVVFLGKTSRWEEVRKAVVKSFSSAEVWEGIDNPDEIVAYGAAYLAYEDKEMPMNLPDALLDDVGREFQSDQGPPLGWK